MDGASHDVFVADGDCSGVLLYGAAVVVCCDGSYGSSDGASDIDGVDVAVNVIGYATLGASYGGSIGYWVGASVAACDGDVVAAAVSD